VAGQSLSDEAEVEGGDLAVEDALQQPVLAEGLYERAIDAAVVGRERREDVAGKRLGVLEELQMRLRQMRVRGQAITAVATSSTFAASSKSALTPSSAIAG
jgi:hypothetical protein